MSDLIDRQEAIDALLHNQEVYSNNFGTDAIDKYTTAIIANDVETIAQLPPAQPTLYGYKIEHLAYIARVMQKEGVTADYAVRTFDDMSRAIKLIIDEAQQKVEEALNERFDQQTGGD